MLSRQWRFSIPPRIYGGSKRSLRVLKQYRQNTGDSYIITQRDCYRWKGVGMNPKSKICGHPIFLQFMHHLTSLNVCSPTEPSLSAVLIADCSGYI